MSPAHADLLRTIGYLVADVKGRIVGTVEAPMYGSTPDVPDAISVSGFAPAASSGRRIHRRRRRHRPGSTGPSYLPTNDSDHERRSSASASTETPFASSVDF